MNRERLIHLVRTVAGEDDVELVDVPPPVGGRDWWSPPMISKPEADGGVTA